MEGIYPVTYVPVMSYSVPIHVNDVIYKRSSNNNVADCSNKYNACVISGTYTKAEECRDKLAYDDPNDASNVIECDNHGITK